MHRTLQALVTETQKALYQSAGPGVQVYSQGIIEQHINQAFKHCYRSEWWPQFRKREVRTLNGTTGQVTVPFVYIKDWEDIQHVFRRNSDRPLPQMPSSQSTLDFTGTQARYIEADGTSNLFTIYPLTALDNVEVVGRTTYDEFALTDIVPFDDTCLIHFAAWSYFTDDAANPASAMKHQGLFETRMQKLRDDSFPHAVAINNQNAYIPDRWR